jgi:hypothetical protein
MSETQVNPATEAAVQAAMASIEKAVAANAPHPSAAVIDAVFVQHLNTIPIGCEPQMRPLIEAARRDLKTKLAAV